MGSIRIQLSQRVGGRDDFAAGAYALSHVARDAGKRLEGRLLAEWGGWPSTAVLEHRNSTFDEVTKSRFHKRLVELGAVEAMPTPAEEIADPGKADARYSAAATWLRSKTRDAKKFPLVFEENINYNYSATCLEASGTASARPAWGSRPMLLRFGREYPKAWSRGPALFLRWPCCSASRNPASGGRRSRMLGD